MSERTKTRELTAREWRRMRDTFREDATRAATRGRTKAADRYRRLADEHANEARKAETREAA